MTMTVIFDPAIISHSDDDENCKKGNVVEKKMTVNDSDRWSSAHMLTTSLSNIELSFHFVLISLFSPRPL